MLLGKRIKGNNVIRVTSTYIGIPITKVEKMAFSIIPFLLLAIPVLEIAVFIIVGGQIGIAWTLGLILVTAILGSILLRVQGFQIINQLREESNAGRIPGKELGHGAMILVAGVLLLTPGFVTDTMGFLLFVPPVRNLIWSFLASRIKFVDTGGFGEAPFSRSGRQRDNVVDLDDDEFRHLDDDDLEEMDDQNPQSPWSSRQGKKRIE